MLALGLCVGPLAQANVGRIPGTYSVSADGAATYTIPIWAPKGPNGLEPHIALTYSSQADNGYMGVGWALSGLSAITRCNHTYAEDGQASPVKLTASDAFCLDGQRLRPIPNTSGTYQTEIANFSQVTWEGSAPGGPAYWQVQGKDGLTYEYGNGGNSQVLASGTSTPWQWWLDKITDRAGNTLTITYSTANATGTVVPDTISWTPTSHGATSYAYTMKFSYGSNAAQSSVYGYLDATPISNTNLLQSIAISYNSALVKEYFLSYQQSINTSKELLTKATECADSAQSNCLAPTTFTYYQDQQGNGVSSGSTTVNLGGTASWYLTGHDLNDDGYRDLIYQVGTTWYVAFGSASGYGTPINTGINTPTYVKDAPTLLVGDLLGNGQDELLANNGGTWYAYTWNGSSFSAASTGLAYNSSAIAFALADTTGDGKPNLIELLVNSSNAAEVYILPNTSSGSTVKFGSPVLAYTGATGANFNSGGLEGPDSQHDAPITRFDFDGDGSDDLVLHMSWYDINDLNGKQQKIYIHLSYELLSQGMTFTGTTLAYGQEYYLKWNDGKCTDAIVATTLYVSGCNGNAAASYTLPGYAVAVMDWDGGGRDAVLYDSGGYLYVQPSTGSGLGTPFSTGIAYNSSAQYASADIESDDLDDLLTWSGSTLTVNMHTGQGEPLDTLSQIKDGYGNTAAPQFVTLDQGKGSTYTPLTGSPPTNYANLLDPLYVVNKTTYSDPSSTSGGTYTRTYYYKSALMSLTGYGFVGFASRQINDSRNGLWETFDYDQQFPYIGLITSASLAQSQSGNPLRSLTNTPADIVLSSTQYDERYFPYISQSTLQQYEVGGSYNGGAPITTAKTSYAYDDYGNATSIDTTVTDNDGGSPYYGSSWTTSVSNTPDVNSSTWCLPLLSESQVTYSDTYDNSSVAQTRQLTPDFTSGNCRYSQIVTAPNTAYQVTDNLGYDSFGNINSDTVTGTGMSARTTSVSWGTTGQFPVIIQDPVGYADGYEDLVGYNYGLGLVTSEGIQTTGGVQDAPPTQWAYDPFGRLEKETRPDGTYTTWSYSSCGTDPLCAMVITEQPHDTANNVINTITEELDKEDRPYLGQKSLIDDSTATVMQKSYDSLGRVVSEQAPYEGSEVGATTFAYDVLNRINKIERPISAGSGTLATTSYQYAGRTTTITDPKGNTRTLVTDVNGWLRHTTDATGYTVIMGYDAAGSRTSVTDNQGNTLWTGNWAYGIAPFLAGETSMDRGSWGYTVDALGERVAWTDAKGQHFSESYDALSRPQTRSEPDLFTQWTWGSTPAQRNVGQLQAVCTGTGSNPTGCASSGESESWSYDGDGRLYQRAITLPNAGTYTYTWQYNSTTGLLNSLTYPVGVTGKALTLQYGYAYGYLQSITDTLDSPNIVVWQANAMNAAGQITTDTLGNAVVTTRAFDSVTHFLDSIHSGVGGGQSLQDLSYLPDADLNVYQRIDGVHNLTENFNYDADNRLHTTTLNGTQNLEINYDTLGNISQRTDVANNATWTYDPTHKHQVTEAGSTAYEYTYDANGNMETWLGNTVSWTAANDPSQIADAATGESVSFSYGPDRKPWVETTQEPSGTTETYHLGSLMSIEIGGSGDTDRDYIYAGNDPVAVDVPGTGASGFHYFLADHQESISAITNSSGQVAVNESFTPYGVRRNPATGSGPASSSDLAASAGITQHGYTFQRALGEQMNLNDMVGRVEDATIGRFMSADPTVPYPDDPQSWNPYSYTRNNPLTYVDPSGFGDGQPCNGAEDLGVIPGFEDLGNVMICWGSDLPSYDITRDGSGHGGNAGGGGGGSGQGGNSASNPNNAIPALDTIVMNGRRAPTKFAVPLWLVSVNTISVAVVDGSGGHGTPQSGQCTKPSLAPHGGGVTFGGEAEAGVPKLAGAAVNASVGAGVFHSSGGFSAGAFGSEGVTAFAGNSSTGTPAQAATPTVGGISVGGGFSLFATNAESVQELSGPFNTLSLNLGVGPLQFSLQVAYANGIYEVSLSPPAFGETLGFSGSKMTTVTATSNGGCP